VGRQRKKPRNMFLDVEAEVDEDDEDEEDDYDRLEEDDFIAGQSDEDELPEAYSRPRRVAPLQEDKFDPEAEEARLKRLYGRSASRIDHDVERVPQQFLLPDVSSPKLWLVRCRIGKEKELVFNLMRKFLMNEYKENPLIITSAVWRENLKGFIYVEAHKQAHVQQALENMNGVFSSKTSLVPIKEMVDVMTIIKTDPNVKIGSWVRVKRGKYQGDLAQVIDVIDSN
jgi:transcription elongation factor SPT5